MGAAKEINLFVFLSMVRASAVLTFSLSREPKPLNLLRGIALAKSVGDTRSGLVETIQANRERR